jgi:hypothetical protein
MDPLVQRLMPIQLNSNNDVFKWNLVEFGRFSVKSMYLDMLNDNTVFLRKKYMETKSSPEYQDLYVVRLSKRNFNKR